MTERFQGKYIFTYCLYGHIYISVDIYTYKFVCADAVKKIYKMTQNRSMNKYIYKGEAVRTRMRSSFSNFLSSWFLFVIIKSFFLVTLVFFFIIKYSIPSLVFFKKTKILRIKLKEKKL